MPPDAPNSQLRPGYQSGSELGSRLRCVNENGAAPLQTIPSHVPQPQDRHRAQNVTLATRNPERVPGSVVFVPNAAEFIEATGLPKFRWLKKSVQSLRTITFTRS